MGANLACQKKKKMYANGEFLRFLKKKRKFIEQMSTKGKNKWEEAIIAKVKID